MIVTRQLKFRILCSKPPIQQQLPAFKTFRSFRHEHQVFDKAPKPKLNFIHRSLLDHVHRKDHFEALSVFKNQIQTGLSEIDEVAVAIALKACRDDPKFGSQLHGFATISGLLSFVTVSNSLMSMYSKSGQFDQTLRIFEQLKNPDTVSYNTVLSGFENGEDALSFSCRLHSEGIVFDSVSYTTLLAHSTDNEEFQFGMQLHSLVLKFGLDRELFVGNALVTMYSKWGKIVEAERIFCEIPSKDSVSWNAMLSGYAQEGSYGWDAILGFIQMFRERVKIDNVSLTSVVSACAQERQLKLGMQIHSLAIKIGYGTHVSVCNVLISMYAKCNIIEEAKLVFESMIDRNVISWTTMLSIIEEDAMYFFKEMRRDAVYPNEVTFVGLIHAIATNSMVQEGLMIHGFCIKANFLSKLNVANSFITMYAKFESMKESMKIFYELEYREIVSWNALISGYAQNGMYQEALETFLSGLLESHPNEYSFGSVLNAIGLSESIPLRHGQLCHSYLLKLGLNHNPIVLGALLDMYAKRGSIFEAKEVFHEADERSQVAWTAIISAHSRHGDYESVMSLFEDMKKNNVEPDSITFLSVLTACGRKGMVDMGIEIFNSMIKDHLIEPSSEHYSCVVDMLGRAGRLKEAEDLVGQIPGGPGLSVLQSLLGACKIYGHVDMAIRLAEALIEMKPKESGSYVLMSNLFAEKGLWQKVAGIRKGMRDKGIKKEIGFSWADVGKTDDSFCSHGFSSEDKSHPKTEEIYRIAELLGSEMKYLEKENDTGKLPVD
ncbi:hypothetical protein M9H77_24568 [Catharanthus roseus]|uniref:Uncharacterized protein n=1 Tax=Catharanthus roseus TaxID=4058 RepID=A0ACC0AWK1_CATRO|nr:hypothetical protein M9H77_24568 [Catharanthus roseus]